MQIKNHPELFKETLRVIEKYTPNTHEAMLNAYWPVTGVNDHRDLEMLARKVHPKDLHQLKHALSQAGAVTVESSVPRAPCPGCRKIHANQPPAAFDHSTWFNMPALYRQAARNDFDLVKSVATTAIHEWTHRRGYDEDKAYPAGVRFAEQMGDRELAEFHRDLYWQWQQEQAHKRQELELARRWGLAA